MNDIKHFVPLFIGVLLFGLGLIIGHINGYREGTESQVKTSYESIKG